MHKYRSLFAWQQAHKVAVLALTQCDSAFHPRSKALFDQLRRAAISVEANIVEGYALGTSPSSGVISGSRWAPRPKLSA